MGHLFTPDAIKEVPRVQPAGIYFWGQESFQKRDLLNTCFLSIGEKPALQEVRQHEQTT